MPWYVGFAITSNSDIPIQVAFLKVIESDQRPWSLIFSRDVILIVIAWTLAAFTSISTLRPTPPRKFSLRWAQKLLDVLGVFSSEYQTFSIEINNIYVSFK